MRNTREDEFRAYAVGARARLVRTATLLTAGDRHLAEDLVQTTLTRLYLAWPRIRTTDGPDGYAQRTLVNALIDERRRPFRRRETSHAEVPDRVSPAPHDDPDSEVLGLIRTDHLPDLAARWLAADLIDTEAVRMLAGHDSHDPWALEQLLADAMREAQVEPPQEPALTKNIVVDYVTTRWRYDRDTRGAVSTFARFGETDPDFDLGLFVGFGDNRNGGWGRLAPDLKAAAKLEIEFFLHGP